MESAIGSPFRSVVKTDAVVKIDTGTWEQWSRELAGDPNRISEILKQGEQEHVIKLIFFMFQRQNEAKTVLAAWSSMPQEYRNNETLAFYLLNLAGRTKRDTDMVYEIVESFGDELKKDIDVMAHAIGYNMEVIKLVPESLKRNVAFASKLVIHYYDTGLDKDPWTWFDRRVLKHPVFKEALKRKVAARGTFSSYG